MPKAITRDQTYGVSGSPWIGISGLRADLRFDSAEACARFEIEALADLSCVVDVARARIRYGLCA